MLKIYFSPRHAFEAVYFGIREKFNFQGGGLDILKLLGGRLDIKIILGGRLDICRIFIKGFNLMVSLIF